MNLLVNGLNKMVEEREYKFWGFLEFFGGFLVFYILYGYGKENGNV